LPKKGAIYRTKDLAIINIYIGQLAIKDKDKCPEPSITRVKAGYMIESGLYTGKNGASIVLKTCLGYIIESGLYTNKNGASAILETYLGHMTLYFRKRRKKIDFLCSSVLAERITVLDPLIFYNNVIK